MTVATRESVTVDVVVTLDDHVRQSELLLSSPDMRRLYYRRWIVGIVLFPPVGLAVGILVGFVTDRSHVPTRDTLQALWSDRSSILTAWAAVTVLMIAMMIAYRLLRRPQLRAQSRMLLRERHGIDRDDPELRERARCSFGPEGFSSVGDGGEYHARWAGVTGLDETPELLVLRTGRFTGFVLPRRDLTEDAVAAIHRIVAANVGAAMVAPAAPAGPQG